MSKPQAATYSPFALLLMIRDAATTRGAQRALLNAIALRCRAEQQYSAYPSYACLAEDTLLDQKTLRRAARALEAAGLISRKGRGNHTNRFYLNVSLLKTQADDAKTRRQAEKAAREASKNSTSPFVLIAKETGQSVPVDSDEDIYWNAPVHGGAQ